MYSYIIRFWYLLQPPKMLSPSVRSQIPFFSLSQDVEIRSGRNTAPPDNTDRPALAFHTLCHPPADIPHVQTAHESGDAARCEARYEPVPAARPLKPVLPHSPAQPLLPAKFPWQQRRMYLFFHPAAASPEVLIFVAPAHRLSPPDILFPCCDC